MLPPLTKGFVHSAAEIYPSPGVVESEDGEELRLYYGGMAYTHDENGSPLPVSVKSGARSALPAHVSRLVFLRHAQPKGGGPTYCMPATSSVAPTATDPGQRRQANQHHAYAPTMRP